MLRKTLLLAVGLVLLGAPAAFATITTSSVGGVQQTFDSPCVIGDPSCNNPTGGNGPWFPWNAQSGPGAGGNYDFTSPTYLIGSGITAVSPDKTGGSPMSSVPTTFSIGVDENIAAGQGAEVLQSFTTRIDGIVSAANSFTGPFTIPNLNNGNGFSDFTLVGFDLSGLPAGTHTVSFEAVVSNDTDGMEEFFIIAGPSHQVPEPATLLLLGVGLFGLGAAARRRVKK